jgi:DNA-binding NarL/FixJ family response regulator
MRCDDGGHSGRCAGTPRSAARGDTRVHPAPWVAKGYLLTDVSLEQLTAAITGVAAAESVIRPVVTERVLRGLEHVRRDFDALSPPDPLTKREVEILRLMAGGYSNREIAVALGTAEGTVKNHASSILSKLGVRDRTRAVLKALELGYI